MQYNISEELSTYKNILVQYIESAGKIQNKDLVEKELLDIIEARIYSFKGILTSFKWPLKIYRKMKLRDLEEHDHPEFDRSLGIFWTWDKNYAMSYWGIGGKHYVMLEAEVSKDSIVG